MRVTVQRMGEFEAAKAEADWGTLGWITGTHTTLDGLTMGRVVIKSGAGNPEHMHTTCDEILYLLAGRLRHSLGDEEVILQPGDSIEIPRNRPHRAWSIGEQDADMIVVYNSSVRDFHLTDIMRSFVASPMCFPSDDLPTVLERFARLGFTRVEAFTSGTASALDVDSDAAGYARLAVDHGLSFFSLHLPVVDSAKPGSLERALRGIDFAHELGVPIAIYKAASIPDYIEHAKAALDRAEQAGVVLVLQNHANSVLSTDDDVAQVLTGVSDDRLRVLLEVGHYEKIGIQWASALERFKDSVAYCHIKDLRDGRSVPIGTGEVDFADLFRRLGDLEYANGYVVELEARDLENDAAAMERALHDSLEHLRAVTGARR